MNQAKGNRLNWVSVKDVKPVKLTPELIKGRALTSKDLDKRRGLSPNKVLVP